MTDRERLDLLRAFGLSDYAGRAYLALLALGTTEARDVSRLARIPLAKIYSTLEQLQERGLVVLPETPKRYAPVPFADFLDRLRVAREEEARDIAASRDKLAEMFPIVGRTEVNDRGSVTVVRGRRSVLDRLRVAAGDAERGLVVLASRGTLHRWQHLEACVAAATRAGARVRVMLPEPHDHHERVAALARLCEVRVLPREQGQAQDVCIFAMDDARVVLAHFIPDDASAFNGKDLALLVEEAALVAALRLLAERSWAAASPWQPRGIAT